MRNAVPHTLFVATFVAALFLTPIVYAEENKDFVCDQFESSEEFVRQAIVLCMDDLPSRRQLCLVHAEDQFENCRFKGNFRRMKNRIQSKILFLSFFKNLVAPKNLQVGMAQ